MALESFIEIHAVQPAGRREIVVNIKGVHPNTRTTVVLDYLGKFGNDVTTKEVLGVYKEGAPVTIAEAASENVLVVEEVELDVASENNEENLIEETEIESTEAVVTVEQLDPDLVTDFTVTEMVTEEVGPVENDVSEFFTEQSFKMGDILMVQRKALHWPCKVIEVVSNKTYKVMVFDKNNTTEIKHEKYLLPFTTDAAVCEGRGAPADGDTDTEVGAMTSFLAAMLTESHISDPAILAPIIQSIKEVTETSFSSPRASIDRSADRQLQIG